MSMLLASAGALLVGALIVGFLAMRFAWKILWRLAMLGLGLGVLALAGGAAYWWFVLGGSLPTLPG